jgi:hypothetical protein
MWKDINDTYEVSDQGEVRNKKSLRILKPFRVGNYKGVWLGAGNKHYVHRLVASTFLTPNCTTDVVDHINRNKHDNRLENLRFCSQSENNLNKDRETIARSNNKTGELFIYKMGRPNKKKFTVIIGREHNYRSQTFDTLEEAIEHRNNFFQQHS